MSVTVDYLRITNFTLKVLKQKEEKITFLGSIICNTEGGRIWAETQV